MFSNKEWHPRLDQSQIIETMNMKAYADFLNQQLKPTKNRGYYSH